MAESTRPDIAPLTWVQSELENALDTASRLLGQTTPPSPEEAADISQHLEQVRGALVLVGFEALAHFLSACLPLLSDPALREDENAHRLLGDALNATRHYIDELLAGQPDRPLRLLPLYTELRAAAGAFVDAEELFYPTPLSAADLPARRHLPAGAQESASASTQALLTHFQRALLVVLRETDPEERQTSIAAMMDAARQLEELHKHTPESALWQAAQAMLEGLSHGDLELTDNIKRLCATLERQLRRGANLSDDIPRRLLREMLYRILHLPQRSELQQAVHRRWQLADWLETPPPISTAATASTDLLSALTDDLTRLEPLWEAHCQDNQNQSLHDEFPRFAERVRRAGRANLDTYLDGLALFLAAERQDGYAISPDLALEFAASLLLIHAGLQKKMPDASFVTQAQRALTRLGQTRQNLPVDPLNALDRNATEQSGLDRLAETILHTLLQAEKILEEYFRPPYDPQPIAGLLEPLSHAHGALLFVGDDQAAALLQHIGRQVVTLAESGFAPASADTEALARHLSALILYLQSILRGHPIHLSILLRPERPREAVAPAQPSAEEHADTHTGDEPAPESGEDENTEGEATAAQPAAAPARRPVPRMPIHSLAAEFAAAARVANEDPTPDDDVIGHLRKLPDDADIPDGLPASAFGDSDEDPEEELFRTFVEEAHTLLAEAAPLIQRPLEVAQSSESVATLRRIFHTLKGSGRLVGLGRYSDTAWAMEEVLNQHIAGNEQAPSALNHLLRSAHKLFSEWTETLQQSDQNAPDPSALLAEIKALPGAPQSSMADADPATPTRAEIRSDGPQNIFPLFLEEESELLAQLVAYLRQWQASPQNTDASTQIARLLHTMKGNANMVKAVDLAAHLHQQEALLSENRPVTSLIDALLQGSDHAQHLLEELRTHGNEAVPASIRVDTDTLQQLARQIGELTLARTRIENHLESIQRGLRELGASLARLREHSRETELQADLQMLSQQASQQATDESFDPLELDRYTRLQELARQFSESSADIDSLRQGFERATEQIHVALRQQSTLCHDMQQTLADTRAAAFRTISERLHRVVRESTRQTGKRARLEITGEDTELERTLLEHITGPLEHLLRNAVAHGIEAPEIRAQHGKSETGLIAIHVRRNDDELQIDLTDDGNGLDLNAITERGRQLRLLPPDGQPGTDTLARLIFHPGFSTAHDVSTVSGRGIGMDIVHAAIDAAKGRLTLHTSTGDGLGIYIRLPLTTVFIPSMLVREGNQTFAISSHLVIRHFEPGEEIIHENTYPTPMLLSSLLGRRPGTIPPEAQHTLLLRSGARILALRCSEFVASREILLQNAGPQLARIPGIQGAALLPDDTIAIAINPFSLIQSSPLNALPGTEQTDDETHPQILIVDDSITVRSHTARTLERAGFQPLAASNGEEALSLVTRNRPALILSDIEMPRMDGFVLLKRLRAQASTAHIPIVMISSRTAEKHRSRAAELGADHYLGKPFNEAELLQTIRKLLARPSE